MEKRTVDQRVKEILEWIALAVKLDLIDEEKVDELIEEALG